MIQKMFTVFDSASQLYGRPFAANATPSAVRAFTDEVNRRDSDFSRHPDDYQLFQCGTFDEQTGKMTGHGPELVVRAKDVVNPQE